MSRKNLSRSCLLLSLLLWTAAAAHAIPAAERSALLDLYNATGGPAWTNGDGWNGPPGTECSWHGVSCQEDAVTRIDLMANNLSGPLPASLGNLGQLDFLRLAFNQLSGAIPTELCALGNLSLFDVSVNQLSGPIPACIGDLADLQILQLTANQLTGSIPAGIGNLAGLQILSLVRNQLSGPLPPELGALGQLQALRIDLNPISGTIPASLGNLTQLQDLILSRTELTGPIPPELGNLTQLIRLLLSSNQLSGAVPPEIGNLSNLIVLDLSANQLAGEVPGGLQNLTNLRDGDGINLGFNALYSGDSDLLAFLEAKGSFWAWQGTQTVAPAGLAVGSPTSTSLHLSWTPIAYAWNPGRYSVWMRELPHGAYELYGSTASKFDASLTVSGLAPGTAYSFVVFTVTDAGAENASTLVSEASAEVSGTTLPDAPQVVEVRIDVKPGSFPNSLNLRAHGKLPVAVFSHAGFDATRVDPGTVTLAGAPVDVKPHGEPMASIADVDHDGLPDLVLHFRIRDLRLVPGDTEAVLEGATFEGLSIRGADSVRIVH